MPRVPVRACSPAAGWSLVSSAQASANQVTGTAGDVRVDGGGNVGGVLVSNNNPVRSNTVTTAQQVGPNGSAAAKGFTQAMVRAARGCFGLCN